jgi:head-tail adaptor
VTGAGDLRSRLIVEAPSESPDGQGGVIRNYVDAGAIWARVTPRPPREEDRADADVALLRVTIQTRAPSTLTRSHRLRDGAKVYRIIAIRDDGGFVTIDTELQVG